MLARRLTTIVPAMTLAEAIETTRIHQQPDHSAVEHGRFRTAQAGDLAGYPTPGTS
jgi:predicted ATPase with chaperone activity